MVQIDLTFTLKEISMPPLLILRHGKTLEERPEAFQQDGLQIDSVKSW